MPNSNALIAGCLANGCRSAARKRPMHRRSRNTSTIRARCRRRNGVPRSACRCADLRPIAQPPDLLLEIAFGAVDVSAIRRGDLRFASLEDPGGLGIGGDAVLQ